MDKQTDNIQVMVRVRPLNDREKREGAKSCIILDEEAPNSIIIDAKPETKTFKFDFVGGDKTTQEDIFQIAAKPLMLSALDGYNACIFAYGQTGAGKTFTMQGRGLEEDRDSKERGVQPRVFDHLFALTSQLKKEGNVEYLVKCSYLEIYNEQIMDLLSNMQSNLMVREDLKKGVYIEGLTEEIAKSSDETIQLLLRGMRNRHVGATNMNLESSRSHSVFSMTIESKKTQDGMVNVKVSKIHFVDLAGSERQKQTAAAGDRLKEASNINKSLTTLGLVINSLVEQAQGRNRHIPYRDSKLTFLLKDSLGGNSRTYMIAAVSAASTSFQETLSTLQFAQRAKMIKNKASINEEAQGNVESLKKEIKRLKEDLLQSKNQVSVLEEQLKGAKLGMEIEDDEQQQQQTDQNRSDDLEIEEDIAGQPQQQSAQKRIKQQQSNQKTAISEEEIRTMLESNSRCLEIEEELKRTVSTIQQSIDTQVIPEFAKKDTYLTAYHQGVTHQDLCETHHKNIQTLYQSRIQALTKLLNTQVDPDALKSTMNENQTMLNEQYEELLKIVGETPNVMNVFDENVELRQKLDKLSLQGNTAEDGETNQIDLKAVITNVKKVCELNDALQHSIEERKFIRDRLDKINLQKMPPNEKHRALEDQIHTLKIEHNDALQALNYDLANLKQKENASERALEQERSKVLQLKQDVIKVKEQRARDVLNHQTEIEELLSQFNHIDDEKNQASDEYEQNIGQLNRRLIELETKLTASKQQIIELQSELTAKDTQLQSEIKTKEQLQTQLNETVNAFDRERCELDSKTNQLKSKFQLMSDEMAAVTENSDCLKRRVQQLEMIEAQLQEAGKEKSEELKKMEQALNEKSDELIHLQQQMETEDDKLGQYEAEKNKIQEELGILTDTYNYQVQEMSEKNTKIEQINELLKQSQKEIEELKLKLSNSSNNAASAGNASTAASSSSGNHNNESGQIAQEESDAAAGGAGGNGVPSMKNDVNENNVGKINKELQEQNHQLRLQVEFESNQNITLRSQMNTLSNRVTELQQSEKHFRTAYLEVRNQLQSLSQRNKDLQQALSSKEMEQYELQRDMKSANENVQFLQERMTGMKNDMKAKEREVIESDNRLKKCKETVIKLQENLRSKMDNLQQALMKNGELETRMAVLMRETSQLKTELKGKSSLSEKRVQELLQSFAQQRAEMAQMQKIINAKIEENIALTANNRLLQSLVEKYTTNEWEIKQQLKGVTDKENSYKKRIDHLIQEYGKLEQESVVNGEVEQLEGKVRAALKEVDNLQRENERLLKQQQFIIKEKDSIIQQLQQSVIEKEKELKDVHSKIAQIQIGIQQAQQYFSKYQMVTEENKKMRADIDLRDHQLKSLENQIRVLKLGNNNNGNNNSNIPGMMNPIQEQNQQKYKEKFVQLDDKYQGLKKKYLLLQQQFDAGQNQLSEAVQQLQQAQQTIANNQNNNNNNPSQQQQNQAIDRLKRENERLVNQIAIMSGQGHNDVQPEMSERIYQLCEFVLTQLSACNNSKELLNNIPIIQHSLDNNMMFILHAFNNLFEGIKSKEQQVQQLGINETKNHKKLSSLEKELLVLKKKLSSLQPGTAGTAQSGNTATTTTATTSNVQGTNQQPNASVLQTPKASVKSSVFKMPNLTGGFNGNINTNPFSINTNPLINNNNNNNQQQSSSQSQYQHHNHHQQQQQQWQGNNNNNSNITSNINTNSSNISANNNNNSHHSHHSQHNSNYNNSSNSNNTNTSNNINNNTMSVSTSSSSVRESSQLFTDLTNNHEASSQSSSLPGEALKKKIKF